MRSKFDNLKPIEIVLPNQPMVASGFVFRDSCRGIKLHFYKNIGVVLENKGQFELIPFSQIKGVRLGEEPLAELK